MVNRYRERDDVVRGHVLKLEEALELNRIYFDDNLCEKIRSIVEQSKNIQSQISKAKLIQRHNDGLIATNRFQMIVDPNEPLDAWIKAESTVQVDIANARLELADEFRTLIGVV